MKRVISTPAVGFHYRLVLAGVLLYAGGAKFFEGGYAAQMAINAYKIFPPAWAPFLGHFLPGLEILLGILLLAGMFVRLTSLLTAILMTGFILGIISVWVRGYSIDCGCFGGGGEVEELAEAGEHLLALRRGQRLPTGDAGLQFFAARGAEVLARGLFLLLRAGLELREVIQRRLVFEQLLLRGGGQLIPLAQAVFHGLKRGFGNGSQLRRAVGGGRI